MSAQAAYAETRATGEVDERDQLTGVRGYYTLLNGFDYEGFAGEDVYVVLCDVDNFRMINDAYGENRGNVLLTRIGQSIQACFGDSHTYRYGSDEFLIVNAFVDEEAFLEKIESLFGQVSNIGYDSKPLHMSCSVGYVKGRINSSSDLHEAIRTADRKMYEAKRLGKARAVGISLAEATHAEAAYAHHSLYKTYETDELTGLANLIYFRGHLEDILESGDIGAGDDRLALVYFNIENFKAYNEHFGFDAGDELLMLVSNAIENAFPGCMAARFSADQFMVAATEGTAIEGIRQVRMAFRKRIKDSSIWLKAGVNIIEDADKNAGVVCDRAKMACDAIKGRRDVFYRIYDGVLKRQILQRRYVLDHFDEALEKGWVKIFYQPIIRVATGEVCDEEALARWADPEEGLISPMSFIPVLEEARLIHRLDLYMVRRACENFARMREDGLELVPVSINLSRLDFELCDIVAEVVGILAEHDVPHNLITIEVTESALAGNQEFLKGEIDRFRAEGFEVWMDDFGSGYSSLHLLTDYSFDLVKVDMGFLRDFEDNEQTRVMLAHIISMSKELGLKTLVEGVETAEQLSFLRAIGCGRAQGYLLGRPASLLDVETANASHDYPDMEDPDKHAYYEAIGRVNLMRPNPVPYLDGHYVPGDAAVAIVRRRAGTFGYLNVSDYYRIHLASVGVASVTEAAELLNTPGSAVRACFDDAIARLNGGGGWIEASYEAGGDVHVLRVRLIARHEPTDDLALLVLPVDVKHGRAAASDS